MSSSSVLSIHVMSTSCQNTSPRVGPTFYLRAFRKDHLSTQSCHEILHNRVQDWSFGEDELTLQPQWWLLLGLLGRPSQSNHMNWWVRNSSRGKTSSHVRAQPKTSSKIAHSRLVFTTVCRGPSVSALLFKNLHLLGLLKVTVHRKSLQKKCRNCGGVRC